MKSELLIGVICDTNSAILAGYIGRAGYRVLRVMVDDLPREQSAPVRAWVVDCDNSGAIADDVGALDAPVVAISNRPSPGELEAYRRWCERIIGTLDRWTADQQPAEHGDRASDPGAWRDVEAVWVMTGSTGALGAVQRFLASFERIPALAFVYAQHMDPRQESNLDVIARANPGFNCALALGRHWLNPGQLLVVPASSQLGFTRQGEVFSTRQPWPGPETPCIDELLLAISGIRPKGAIVWSGAGRDGCRGLTSLASLGTAVWAQEPATCEAPSMPEAAIAEGIVTTVDSPEGLATRLALEYP